jgi:predicted heme/steroid binding protein
LAHNGKVYDVTESSFWMGGDHLGAHQAGKDLTMELDIAPHGPENLDRVKLVGVLV